MLPSPGDDELSDPHWFRDAVIYEVQLRSFADSDGDGIGDLPGLIGKLDYLVELGVTAVWLLPFYPSPRRDDGYDIADYLGVDPALGTLDDFRRLLSEAHARGLRVITELVLNHTSDQHPWFQRARRASPGSPEREWYVWSETGEEYAGVRIIFQDFEPSNWTFDDAAGAYFWHRFFRTQPDLNFDHPAVRAAVLEVLDFWLELGVDGLRLDAVPYLYQREGTSCENLPETHAFLRELRAHVDARFPDRLLLAEANMWPEDAAAYMGAGDECHMNYHFPLMPRLYLALAGESRRPIVEILARTPELPPGCQWGIFLRNHDELTLEMVTPDERRVMLETYAKDPRAPLNLGIRRRLAPLLDNDRARIELMHALLLSLPGTPILYYGDEIGMGDDLELRDRDGVRTPMQWSAEPNAGFSAAPAERLERPVIEHAPYDYRAVNVAAQRSDPDSLLHWVRALLALRQSSRLFGRGRFTLLDEGPEALLAYRREDEQRRVLCVFNLSRAEQELELGEPAWGVTGSHTGVRFDARERLRLPGHGFAWLELEGR